jgi:gamma-glutamyltranspeptidase/glutathione hydrolase
MLLTRSLLCSIAAAMLVGCAHQNSRTTSGTGHEHGRHSRSFARAAVAADHAAASEAGAEILRRGGNAVDAAVATSFTLSVVRPQSCGIGGGGFMVIRFNNDPEHGTQTIAINYREMAPSAVTADYYTRLDRPDASTRGGTAVAVPGTVAGLMHALERYGSLDRSTVLAPAIRAAEEGFIVDQDYVEAHVELFQWFNDDPTRQKRFAFVWNRFLGKGNVKPGDRIQLPEQAKALRLIAERGSAAFYRGQIAIEILSTVRRDGGAMRAEDLLGYEVVEVEPLTFNALGHTFLTMPPPSSGGVAIAQILGIVELRRKDLGRRANSSDYVHLLAGAMKHAFADRARWLGDPAQTDVPVERLTSPAYLQELAARIDMKQTRPVEDYGSVPPDDGGTSHFSVIDARGNAVACTETINLGFGSLVAVEEFGFCLNNEMDDFTSRPGEPNAFGLQQSARNAPGPGKRPLSSMTPTIVLDSTGQVILIAGASGGPRIITGTLQAMLNVLLFDLSAGEALSAPRFHHQWMPDELEMERRWYESAVQSGLVGQLESRGHRVNPRGSVGNVQLIRRAKRGPGLDAASDPRRGGTPAGY